MKKVTKIMAFLTAMTMTAGAMGVTAYAAEKTSNISVNSEKETHLYKYSELKSMPESELLDLYRNIDDINRITDDMSSADTMLQDIANNCQTLDDLCVLLAYKYLITQEVGKEGIDLTMRTGIGGSKYLPGRTEDSVAELLDDDSEYELLSPRYLEKIGASLCSRCIIRYDRTFNTYTADMFLSDSLKDTIKTVSEDTELHDLAIAYICAAQLGFTPETQKDLFFDKEDKVTLPEGVDIRAIGEEMFEYMEKNEVDVYMGIGESFVDIRYLDEKAVAAVDEYMEENDINKEYVKMTEMSDNDKRRIIKYRIGKYRSENKLSVGTYIKRFEDETIGICIKYYLAHEADKPVIEKFIADRGYDKLFRVEYEFVGDPNADPDSIITDPKTITELINGFIKEKGLDSYAYQGNNCVYLTINGRLNNEDDYSQIKKFMTEKHIDQYMVYTDILESGINGTISTLRGDADLNGDVDLADLTVVAKYTLSNEAYPLANDTAYANADMNGDGKVDGLDTSALIENQLGK